MDMVRPGERFIKQEDRVINNKTVVGTLLHNNFKFSRKSPAELLFSCPVIIKTNHFSLVAMLSNNMLALPGKF